MIRKRHHERQFALRREVEAFVDLYKRGDGNIGGPGIEQFTDPEKPHLVVRRLRSVLWALDHAHSDDRDAAAEALGRQVRELKEAMAEVIYADDAMKHRIPRRRGGPVGMEVDPEAVEAMMDHYDRAIARITTMAGLVGCPRCGTHVPLLHAGDGTDRYTAHGPVEDGNDCPLSGALIP